jgi:ADP-ribosylglycohydrolase
MSDYNNFFVLSCILDLFSANIYLNVYDILLNEQKNPNDAGEILSEYLSHVIANGGISKYKFDDNIENTSNIFLMLSIVKMIIDVDNSNDSNISLFELKKTIKKTLDDLLSDEFYSKKMRGYLSKIRYGTEDSIKNLSLDDKFIGNKNNNYNSDICVYTIPFGYYYNNDVEMMINNCVKLIKLTHYNVISILSGITSSYFISMAYNKISIEKWAKLVLELLSSEKIKKYLELDTNENMSEYISCMKIWNNYVETRFTFTGNADNTDYKVKKTKSDNNLIFKMKFYKRFTYESDKYIQGEDSISCLIMTYDALLNCEGNFEKMMYYSILTPGNGISIGCLIGELYNLIYGLNDVPKYMIEHIKDKRINNLSKKFFDKIKKN